jgi:hypothetical protein
MNALWCLYYFDLVLMFWSWNIKVKRHWIDDYYIFIWIVLSGQDSITLNLVWRRKFDYNSRILINRPSSTTQLGQPVLLQNKESILMSWYNIRVSYWHLTKLREISCLYLYNIYFFNSFFILWSWKMKDKKK